MPRGIKDINEYQKRLPHKLYSDIPKSVFAAIAVSFASTGGDHLDRAERAIVNEWHALYNAGIIGQKPTVPPMEEGDENA